MQKPVCEGLGECQKYKTFGSRKYRAVVVNNKKGAVDDVCALWPVTKLSGSKEEMNVRFLLEDDDVDTAEELPINVPLSAELTNKTPTKRAS